MTTFKTSITPWTSPTRWLLPWKRDDALEGAVLITGATGGLGSEFSRQFAKRGCPTLLVGRKESALAQLASELSDEYGVESDYISCDLSVPGSAAFLFEECARREISVETLVNNAGFAVDAPFFESPLPRQSELVQVNVSALTEMCRLFGEPMRLRGHGAILNVASVAGFMSGPYMATYYASKAYVLSLTCALHSELSGSGVHVTAVCPGPVRTPFWQGAGASHTPLAHMAVSPRRIAFAARWALKLNLAKYVPGIVWKVVTFSCRILPRSWAYSAASLLQRPKKAKRETP